MSDEFHTCSAPIAALWKRRSVLKSCAISLTSRWKGSFLMSNSVDFWYLRISRSATVPGLQKKRHHPPIRAVCTSIVPSFNSHHCSVPVSVRFLHTAGGWRALAGSFGCQLLPRSLSSGGFTSGLLGTSHTVVLKTKVNQLQSQNTHTMTRFHSTA